MQVAAPPVPPLRALVGRRGAAVPLEAFRARLGGEGGLRRLLRTLTVVEKPPPGRPKGPPPARRHAWAVEGGALLLPRAALRALLRAGAIDAVADGPDRFPPPRRLDEGACECARELYPYQAAAVEHLCAEDGPFGPASLAAHRGQAYLEMATGLGKSLVGCAVAARLRVPALVVVPTQALAEQWLEALAEFFPGLRGAAYHNRLRRPPGPETHDLVAVVVNTFRDKGPGFLEGYGLVVLDEAHEYHSPCNARALWLATAPAVLGLSATPLEREDGLDRYVLHHLGPVLRPAAIPGFDASAVAFRGEVRVVEYAGDPRYAETMTTPAGTASAVLTIARAVEDPARLRLVAAEVERLARLHLDAPPAERARLGLGPRPRAAATAAHPEGGTRAHGVLVFAELREYLPALRAALLERFEPEAVLAPELDEPDEGGGGPPPPPAALGVSVLRGGAARGAVSAARMAGAHVVLTTYGFSRRGISLPEMTAAVLATPRRHGLRQILGRILRRGSDESIVRQVVDIVDVRSCLKSQAGDRRKVYLEKGFPLSKVRAASADFAAPGLAAPEAAADEPAADPLAALGDAELLALALGE